jgi:hypothetical protein
LKKSSEYEIREKNENIMRLNNILAETVDKGQESVSDSKRVKE